MQTYTITIKRRDIYEEMSKITAYTGSKATEDTGAYERVALTEKQMEMIDTYIDDALVNIEDALDEQLDSVTENDGEISIDLSLSSAWKTQNGASLTKSVFKYVIAICQAQWFGLTKTELQEKREATADMLMMDIRVKANEKSNPKKPNK